ncbi:DUF6603 domain-containing protein [Vitiosangium sp. GDMCC 1.1324]|uniref:DUF6603 domain-containing protein n=1 Tax=Vitiosangium sp. (strain GDMCC 1.1324) TaxID=2138576 RepID=UPI000D332D9A|nr:DUF6603 domain-containing protein [Vitiosangium sp. GDMCC 1.1324]PTL80851.1 hypothetical protein DAT35_26310 [Vitiosangium sp. GDMCC 1.1324]
MTAGELHEALQRLGLLDVASHRLRFDAAGLKRLQDARLADTTRMVEGVCPYFPKGVLDVGSLESVAPPAGDAAMALRGVGGAGPFLDMAVEVALDLVEVPGGLPHLRLVLSAWGRAPTPWTVARSFPGHAGTMLADLRFPTDLVERYPFFQLRSHAEDGGAVLGVSGLLDLASPTDTAANLFLGEGLRDQVLPVIGGVLPSGGDASAPPEVFLMGWLSPEIVRRVGNLVGLEDLRFVYRGRPDYNMAIRRWTSSAEATWFADLVFPGETTDTRIPVVMRTSGRSGVVEIRSSLPDGLSMPLAGLSALVPQAPLRVPEQVPVGAVVKLTDVSMRLDPSGGDLIQWVSLDVEVADENRWVLLDRFLTLDAIDLGFTLHAPTSEERQVELAISGLVGIGESGTIRLTTLVYGGAFGVDYEFSGGLVEDSELDVTQLISHFMGHERYPALPSLSIRDLAFSYHPGSGRYSARAELNGAWLVPGGGRLEMEGLTIGVEGAGHGAVALSARGVFYFLGSRAILRADHVGEGRGWIFEGDLIDDPRVSPEALAGGALEFGARDGSGAGTPVTPRMLSTVALRDLHVRVDTGTQEYAFRGTGAFRLGEGADTSQAAALTLHLDARRPAADRPHEISVGASLSLFEPGTAVERVFSADFDQQDERELMVAAYGGQGSVVDLGRLLAQLMPSVQGWVPSGLSVGLNHAQLALLKSAEGDKALFAVELGTGLELSKLPLVGGTFPRGRRLDLVFQLLLARDRFESGDIAWLNQLTPSGVTKLREEGVDAGATLHAHVQVAGISSTLDLPLQVAVTPVDASTRLDVSAPARADSAKVAWVDLQKGFGPLHVGRVGVGLSGQQLVLLLDASLHAPALTLSLQGLGVGFALSDLSAHDFAPRFHLDGLGVDLRSGDLELGGGLRHLPGAEGEDRYDGALTLRYGRLAISALGSYARMKDGHPSMFVWALVDAVGGPTFFRVEGMSVGFGYNRRLVLPTAEGVRTYPLVTQAMAAPSERLDLWSMAERLLLTPAVGEHFLGVGVHFTSFQLIEGVALLFARFGSELEFDLLGEATLRVPAQTPPGGTPLVNASLSLLARFLPEQGELCVRGVLSPGAYVLSPDCHLSGGFALASWFHGEHAGDFVLTLGGYHPSFRVPAWYPKVPRLALNWRVDERLTLKADAYLALTPSAVMTGGHFEADWRDGSLHAWFRAGLDMVLGWKPYRYHAEASISIGVTYGVFSADLTAELVCDGPPFSGRAHVSWLVFSFDLEFGRPARPPPAVTWGEFRADLLPAKGLLVLNAAGGRAPDGGGRNGPAQGELGTLHPGELRIRVDSAVPITSSAPGSPRLGVAPMAATLDSTLSVEIKYGDEIVTSRFQIDPVSGSVPAALWGQAHGKQPHASLHAPRLIEDVVVGYEIRSKPHVPGSPPTPITLSSWDTHQAPALTWPRRQAPTPVHLEDSSVVDQIATDLCLPETRAACRSVVEALLPDLPTRGNFAPVRSFRAAPRLVRPLEHD